MASLNFACFFMFSPSQVPRPSCELGNLTSSLVHHVIQAERTSGSYIVDDLYNEFHWFQYGKSGFDKCIGHFSQVMPTT